MKTEHPGRDYLFLAYFAVFNFVLHLLTNGEYGFHRDELYFLDCAKHLSFGYADLPPLTPLLGRIAVNIFGETLTALRFFPALATSLAVFYTGLITRELNGNRFAQSLAMIALIATPVYLVSGTQFQTIPFDQLVWIICCYLLIRIIKTNEPKFFIWLGITIGIGFLNKYTMVFLGLALISGLIIEKKGKLLTRRWFWAALAITFSILLPNLIWQILHDMPVFDHMQALHADIADDYSILNFLIDQLLIINPVNAIIWSAGLYFYFSNNGKAYRTLVWIFIIPLLIFSFTGAKSYYLSPAFPLLFAGGAVLIEKHKNKLVQRGLPVLLILSFIVTLPAWLPVLSIEKNKQYGLMDLRYDYREMVGWQEMVKSIADVYRQLAADEQKKTTIFTGNYGEAGAVNHYGPQYHLPKATSAISSYYLWGPDPNADIYIVIGGYPEDYLHRYFRDVRIAGTIKNRYDIENEEYNQPFHICRGLIRPISDVWPEWRHF